MIKGVAREIRQMEEALDALRLPVFPWHDSPKPRYVRIEPDAVVGRRFRVSGGTATEPEVIKSSDPGTPA